MNKYRDILYIFMKKASFGIKILVRDICCFDIKILAHDLYCVTMLPVDIFKELIFDVYLLSGKTKKVMYVKPRSVGINQYFVERICDKDVIVTKIKKVYIWELRNFAKRQDAVLIDIHKYFVDLFDEGFLVPQYVRQVLDISMSVDEAIKLKNKELKKVYKYSYEVSKDRGALKIFYEKMYVPHIKRKYDVIEDFIYLKKSLIDGELILIKHDKEYVSGALCEMHGDTYYCQKNGVSDERLVGEGALIATYYFSILRAKEIDAKIVDLGLSKPFLSDGVLWHKNLWGGRICEQELSTRFFYLKNVLFEQPFIYINNGKLKIAIFSENDMFVKGYANSGLEFSIVGKDKNVI